MRKIFIFALFFCLIILAGCQIKENYSMTYGFTLGMAQEERVDVKQGNLEIEIPLADFTCDIESANAILERDDNNFFLTLSGNETEDRCAQTFFAEIQGIGRGKYELEINYHKGQEIVPILFRDLTID